MGYVRWPDEEPDSFLATYVECIVDAWVVSTSHSTITVYKGDRLILTVANAKRFAQLGRCRIMPESEWPA
jgi:hypothetical protein